MIDRLRSEWAFGFVGLRKGEVEMPRVFGAHTEFGGELARVPCRSGSRYNGIMRLPGIAKKIALLIGIGSFAVLLLAGVFWQELAVQLEIHRMHSDPAHLEDVFMELRSNYGGSVPLWRGDGLPLLPENTESIALRRLIADSGGAQVVKEALRRDAGEKYVECPLHDVLPELTIVKVKYGLEAGKNTYWQVREKAFPRAGYCSGGCVIGEANEAIVFSCTSCNAAEKVWRSTQR